MNKYLLLLFSILVVLIINLLRYKKYGWSCSQAILISGLEFTLGILGTLILFFIENNEWGGTSFFGAVLLIPVFFLPISKCFRLSYARLMDYVAPSGLAMYMVNKWNCYVAGCCVGRNIGFSPEGIPKYFPSQIVEIIVTGIIVIVLLILECRMAFSQRLYPLGLILYGLSRFVLNMFREEWVTTKMIMPFGNIWSLVAIGVGVAWLFFQNKRKVSSDEST